MPWVTRSHVHVNHVARLWLGIRFINNQTEFLFGPKSQIHKMIDNSEAPPFDTPEVEPGYHEPCCSFGMAIQMHEPNNPALLRQAGIVSGAGVAPEIASDAIFCGLQAIAADFASPCYQQDAANRPLQVVADVARYAWRKPQFPCEGANQP